MSLLSIENLKVAFRLGTTGGVVQRVQAVGRGEQGVSLEIAENTTVALVGESGSGKSVTAMAILNLLPDNAERSGRSASSAATCCRRRAPSCRRCAARTSPACSRSR